MNITNAVSRIDVIVHTEPEWWQILAALTPLAVLLGLVSAVIIVRYAVRLQPLSATAEQRAEWWNRAEWALDMALDEKPERRNVGLAVLEQLGTSRCADKDGVQIVAEAKAVLNRH